MSDILPSAGTLLIVLSGPSAAGKDVLLSSLKREGYPLHYIVTVTTRPRRKGEKEGEDYQFVSTEEFHHLRDSGRLLEWANVYGHYYGVPSQPVRQALEAGTDVMIKVDVQGAATLKRLFPQALFVFLTSPSEEELEERLRRRKSESEAEVKRRLERAAEEARFLPMFDYVVVNREGRLDEAINKVKAIITAEKCRTIPRIIRL